VTHKILNRMFLTFSFFYLGVEVRICEAELSFVKPEPGLSINRRFESGLWPIIGLSFRPKSGLLKV
jgi:hypothetical protein